MAKSQNKDKPYHLHRLALQPLLPDTTPADIEQACQQARTIDEKEFLGFLLQQGLAPMWDKMLEDSNSAQLVSTEFKASLHQARLLTTGRYLLYRHSVSLIDDILQQAGIAHVIYKGADLRERLYAEPALRPAADIDVLIAREQKIPAIKAFKQQGFALHPSADIVSHETSLIKGMTSIDLHWDILRPGRTRIPMANTLLESATDYQSHHGLSDEASLFIMLVHTVFAKYATAPNASLMRMVDLSLLLATRDIDWNTVLQLLSDSGLKTAAWITFKWYQILTDIRPPNELMPAIKPGRLRQKYLSHWLQRNVSSTLFDKPIYVQLGLTLPAHDRWSDAFNAIQSARKLRHSQQADLEALLQQTR